MKKSVQKLNLLSLNLSGTFKHQFCDRKEDLDNLWKRTDLVVPEMAVFVKKNTKKLDQNICLAI